MCMLQPDPARSGEEIQNASARGGNVLTNLVKRNTQAGRMLDGENRQKYLSYAESKQAAGRNPVPYAQWLQMNRHSR